MFSIYQLVSNLPISTVITIIIMTIIIIRRRRTRTKFFFKKTNSKWKLKYMRVYA